MDIRIIKKKYPVKMENNKIIPTKPISNDKLKKKLKILSFCTIWQL